ncbi:MAG: hypothetical protein JNM25_02255, partial [Planctomycetes bacterium]|nr:hypothetical protein [Planctomycetota bacterium]
VPTRRVFLLAGITFAVGTAAGGWSGYAIGAAAGDGELEPTGDADLDELRRLAVKAPIEELLAKRLVFLNCLFEDYPRDRILWSGARRIAEALVAGREIPDRRLYARFLAQVIESNDPEFTAPLLPLAPALRKVK